MGMMVNPLGLPSFPQPPPTPLFPSDFLPVRERILKDFFEGLKAHRGAYIIKEFFPYFSTAKIPANILPLPPPSYGGAYIIKEFFPYFQLLL